MFVLILLQVFFVVIMADNNNNRWNEKQIIEYMTQHPNRCYFSDLFAKGGFRVGAEVGVAGGRFSELFLIRNKDIGPWKWYMVEPFLHKDYVNRFPEGPKLGGGNGTTPEILRTIDPNLSWDKRGIGKNAAKTLIQDFSTNQRCIDIMQKEKFDFIYLDGAHDYVNVKKELLIYWKMLKPGGVLAGHDYCNHGEPSLPCKGCEKIPMCRPYTPFVKHKKAMNGRSKNQQEVVKAVQEWLVEEHPELTLHHTSETFTRESLAKDNFNYDLVITSTYNPSWFFIKPTL